MNKLEECVKAAAKESTNEGKTRAVIRCLMQPTREMCTAGACVDAVIGFSDDSEKVFRSMLQSVLDGKE